MADLHFTHIYERILHEFDIDRDEYALCNYTGTWAGYPGNKRPGWCDRTLEQKAAFVRISSRAITKMQHRMIEKGLLEKDEITGNTKTTKKWFHAIHDAKEFIENRDQKSPQAKKGSELSSQSGGIFVPNGSELSSQSGDFIRNNVPTHNKIKEKISKREKEKNDFASLSEVEIDTPQKILIAHLNTLTGSSFNPKTKETASAINARLTDFSLEDLISVIDYKVAEWGGNPDMAQYLRPSTLFRPSNFEGYLMAARSWVSRGKPSFQKHSKNGISVNSNQFIGKPDPSAAGAFAEHKK